MTKRLLVTSLAFAFFSTQAVAASFSINPPVANGPLGGGATNPAIITIDYAAEGGTADGIDVTLSFDDTLVDVTRTGSCNYVANSGTVTVTAIDLNSDPLPDNTYCSLTFTVLPGAPVGDIPLTLSAPILADNGAALPGAVDLNDGVITVSAAPPDVVLAFSPDSAVAFPGGVSGTNTVTDIDVTVGSGTVGTGTIDNCVLGGLNPTAFTIVSGSATVPPADTIDLQVELANVALSATLTCDLDDASAATSKVFNLTAPAGTPVPAPEFTSSPTPGSALTCNGAPASVVNTSVTITNAGDLALTFNCSVSGDAAFVLGAGGVGNLAPGASQAVNVSCTVPAEDAPAVAGSLDCTSNDPAFADVDYPLSSIAATALPPVPQPNVVPASSMWSQLSLIGLLAALGLLVVGIRRKG